MDVGSIAGDRDIAFADWSETVTLREVSRAYDAQNGRVSESYTERMLRAIVRPVETEPLAAAAGQHARSNVQFVVRTEDVEQVQGLRTCRVMRGGVEFRIDAVEVSGAAGLTVLRCSAV